MSFNRDAERAFTVVEILIASAISVVIMLVLSNIFSGQRRTSEKMTAEASFDSTAINLIQHLRKDIVFAYEIGKTGSAGTEAWEIRQRGYLFSDVECNTIQDRTIRYQATPSMITRTDWNNKNTNFRFFDPKDTRKAVDFDINFKKDKLFEIILGYKENDVQKRNYVTLVSNLSNKLELDQDFGKPFKIMNAP